MWLRESIVPIHLSGNREALPGLGQKPDDIISGMAEENADRLISRLRVALKARQRLLDADHSQALRLFNGFTEGWPELTADLYARTLVLYGYASSIEKDHEFLHAAQEFYLKALWIDCVVHKIRSAGDSSLRRGMVTYGGEPAGKVLEHGVWYALDLLMNQDASLYLDTRGLRRWLLEQASGWEVLNIFAYTGSLGVAALAGGAARVIQVDRSRKFMRLALLSCEVNKLDTGKMKLQTADYFSAAAYFKRKGELFDCAIVDPPYFSTTGKGTIDQERESSRVINKLRPMVRDGGYLVVVNNALFLKGSDFMRSLESLCQDGYLAVETIIPVEPDVAGFPETVVTRPPTDPAPFNHPTKIVVLRVKRKGASGR